MTYAEKHISKVNFWFLVGYALHLPVFIWVAHHYARPFQEAIALAGLAVAGPLLAHYVVRGRALSAAATAVGGMLLSAGLIHLAGGRIEMHFHVFVLIPLFAVFGLWWVVAIAAATIAVHHVSFFFFRPESLFNYQAGFGVVLLHAAFVVLAALPGFFIARLVHNYVVGAGEAVGELGETGHELKAAAEEFSAASAAMASEASSQVAGLQKSHETLNRLISELRDNASQLGQVRAAQLKEMQAEMRLLGAEGDSLLASMRDAREASGAIGGIVKTIEEIAFQTNILALNAAVEAARAGSAGAGFAVVAEEVRTLASRAAEAARETGRLISAASLGLNKGEGTSARVLERLRSVEKVFVELDRMIEQIGAGIDQQSRDIGQIGESMDELDRNALAGSARSEEIASSSEMLKQLAVRVARAIDALRGDKGRATRGAGD